MKTKSGNGRSEIKVTLMFRIRPIIAIVSHILDLFADYIHASTSVGSYHVHLKN